LVFNIFAIQQAKLPPLAHIRQHPHVPEPRSCLSAAALLSGGIQVYNIETTRSTYHFFLVAITLGFYVYEQSSKVTLGNRGRSVFGIHLLLPPPWYSSDATTTMDTS